MACLSTKENGGAIGTLPILPHQTNWFFGCGDLCSLPYIIIIIIIIIINYADDAVVIQLIAMRPSHKGPYYEM